MSESFVEFKTVDNQNVHIRKTAVDAVEEAPATVRAPGHVKLYVGAYKFLIDGKLEDVLKKLDKN